MAAPETHAAATAAATDGFSGLFDFLPIGVYRSSPEGRQLRANPALVRLNGCDSEAELLQRVQDIGLEWYVQPGQREAFKALLERDGFVSGLESEIYRHKSRERIWVREHAHVVRNADGSVRYYEGTVEDISAEVAERRARRKSEDELRDIVSLVPGVVYRLAIAPDGRRRYTYVSEHVQQLHGVSVAEALADGEALARLRHPDNAEAVARRTQAAINRDEPLNYEVRMRLRDGTEKWAQVISAAAPPEGDCRVRVGFIHDISARKAAEAALRGQSELWLRALEATGDGVWDWRVQEGREVLSTQGKAMYGYGPDELADTPDALDAITHPDDRGQMLADREAHFNGGAPRYVNEHRIRCRNGEWKWILSRGLVIERDAQGRPLRMIGTHSDITAARQAEALRLERDRAAAADQAKSVFLSRVSHELRTPLNAILGFAQLLQLDAAALDERQRGWLQQVLSSGRHLLALMEDILDLSSVQSGQLTVSTEPVALRPVFEQAWAMLAGAAEQQGLTLHDEVPGGARCVLLADRKRLQQVLVNLLSNAVKYNRPGGWVRVTAQQEAGHCRLSVQDSGPGLSAEQQARLFNPFDRLGAERGPVPGTGLGLALTRQLVEAMGGRIGVHSVPGQGATFTVTLPGA